MGLLTIIRKLKAKERNIRVLMVYVLLHGFVVYPAQLLPLLTFIS